MRQFYFFTDINYLQTQTDTQAFGPVPGSTVTLTTQYRVNSLHTASQDCKAYAVTSGFIQVQEVSTSSDLVNIILEPFEQPELNGIKVKYFIYRGVKKSSLFSSGQIVSKDSTTTPLDVVKDIWKYQAISSVITGDNDATPAAGILLKTDSSYTKIENIFTTDTTYCLHQVKAGDSIGTFDKDHIGFEIMLDGYNLDSSLSYAKVLDHIITADALSTPPTYAQKAQREQVLYYLDPAALYGMSYSGDGFTAYNSGTKTTIKNDGNNEALFQKVFLNYNVVYLDIRHDTGLSYPFYSDYSSSLDLNFYTVENVSITAKESECYCTNSWPLYKISQIDQLQDNMLCYRPILYISQSSEDQSTNGLYYIPQSRRFSRNLKKEYTNVNGKNRFAKTRVAATNQNKITLSDSDSFILCTFNNTKKNITAYNKFVFSSNYRSSTPFPTTHYIDNLFPIKETLPTVASGTIINKHVGYETYVSNSQKKLVGETVNHKIVPGIYDSCISFDSNRVTLFAVPKVSSSIDSPYDLSHSFENSTENYAYFLKYAETVLKGQATKKFTINPTGTSAIQFLAFTEKLFAETKSQVIENMIAIILTRTEYQKLLKLITDNNLDTTSHPVFIQRVYGSSITEDKSYNGTDSDGKPAKFNYKQLTLQLVGYDATGNIKTVVPSANDQIVVYSADGAIYSSPLASTETDYSNLKASTITDFYEGNYELDLTTTALNSELSTIISVVQNTDIFNTWMYQTIAVGNYSMKIKIDLLALTDYLKLPGATQTSNAITHLWEITYSDGTKGQSISITYNNDNFNDLSEINVARILYHESIHAYLDGIFFITKFDSNGIQTQVINDLYKNYPEIQEYILAFAVEKDSSGNIVKTNGQATIIANSDEDIEMSAQHNLMAAAYRSVMIDAMKEYDSMINVSDRSGTVTFENIFNNNELYTVNYTTDDFYQALSWGGLVHWTENVATRSWRKFASENDESKLRFLLYIVLQSKAQYERASSYPASVYNYDSSYFTTSKYVDILIFSKFC